MHFRGWGYTSQMPSGTSLAVQWLRRHAPNAGGMGLIPGWGTKIPHAAWHGKKKKSDTFTQDLSAYLSVEGREAVLLRAST